MEFCVKDQISFIEDEKEKEQIENIYNGKKFPFIYDGTANINPNYSHNIEKF